MTTDNDTTNREVQAANLFDLRRIIGGLFILYGIILVIVGIGDSDAEIAKAAGVHVNLWTGVGMLVVGALFLVWAFTRPLGEQLAEAESESEPGSLHPGGGPRAHDEGTAGDRDAGTE
jgi:hypothetical protein